MQEVIRPLSQDDVSEIVEMTKNVWGGNDYVPVALQQWMKDSSSYPYVMERRGEVVCAANLRMMDGHRTAWMEGIRVHPDVRREGLGHTMTGYMIDQAKRMNAKRVRLITAYRNRAAVKLATSAGLKPITSMQSFWKGDVSEIEWRFENATVTEIDYTTLATALEKQPALIPEGVLIYHWDAVDTDCIGLESASAEAGFWATEEGGKIMAVSTGVAFDSPREREWFATIYPLDTSAFLQSFSHHLSLAVENRCDLIICTHPPQYGRLYDDEEVLKHRDHEIEIALFERILSD